MYKIKILSMGKNVGNLKIHKRADNVLVIEFQINVI